jgi:putative hydrolase
MDEEGNIDLNQAIYRGLDIVLAGFHPSRAYPMSKNQEQNTRALLNLMEKQYVDIITHPGNPEYPIDIPCIVDAAKKFCVALELNNASLRGVRRGSEHNCAEILQLCLENGNMISLGSDAHISYDIGNLTHVESWIKECQFPAQRILNTSKELLFSFLEERKKRRSPVFENRNYFWEQ